MKKRPIILLELLLAISLSALLMTALFQLFVSNAATEKRLRSTQERVLERTYLMDRLETLFSNLDPSEFYTARLSDDGDDLSLIASFDAGIDPEPHFSGLNLVRLHLNRARELCLTQWPLEEPLFRSEVLLHEVDHIEWSFYSAGQWHSQRNRGDGLPSMVRLSVWHGTKDRSKSPSTQLAFVLPSQETVVME